MSTPLFDRVHGAICGGKRYPAGQRPRPRGARGGRRMRQRTRVPVVGSVSLVLTLVTVWAMAQPSERTSRIAVIASLEPPSARLASIVQNGAQLAVEDQADALKALGVWVELLALDEAASRWQAGREDQ